VVGGPGRSAYGLNPLLRTEYESRRERVAAPSMPLNKVVHPRAAHPTTFQPMCGITGEFQPDDGAGHCPNPGMVAVRTHTHGEQDLHPDAPPETGRPPLPVGDVNLVPR